MQNHDRWKEAISHTLHCLSGCAAGEVLGMIAGTIFGFSNFLIVTTSILLAFLFGYGLTVWSLYKKGHEFGHAVRTAIATDTVSIVSMELIDNAFILFVPGALSAGLQSGLFWTSLLLSLAVAFAFTVPVNWFFIKNTPKIHHH